MPINSTKIIFPKQQLLQELFSASPEISKILRKSVSLHETREELFGYLNALERHYYNIYSDKHYRSVSPDKKRNAKECIRVLKNIIRTENERLVGFSALDLLRQIFLCKVEQVNPAFLADFISLFYGVQGKSSGTKLNKASFLAYSPHKFTLGRFKVLNNYSRDIQRHFSKYAHGLDQKVIMPRKKLKQKILRYFHASENDWEDYSWHLRHIIYDLSTLTKLVNLSVSEKKGLIYAQKHKISFHITPYYLSLFNSEKRNESDRAIRAQVLPSYDYCAKVAENRVNKISMDFMGEQWTSPISNITRRYPQIVILKPYNSCPQICVYCQRNWEIKNISEGNISKKCVNDAIKWIRKNKEITEVLVTGGDPLTLNNQQIERILSKLSRIKQVERIRIGTRTLVTLPFRFDEGLISIFKKYHQLGKREICIVTHFEHSAEITPSVLDAVKKIKMAGISIYNQQVFTYYNSRRFETAFLRSKLKLCGIDPYYTFNTKGKGETIDFRVPIARIEQERKEEARLLPGIVRTDEPVFNVPKIGKSHLRAWQDHEPIGILADGSRVFRFYPWDSQQSDSEDYLYVDVPIYDYLLRLKKDGENIEEYRNIWYYF